MTKMDKPISFSRRAVMKGGGALVVSLGMPISMNTLLAVNAAFAQDTRPPLKGDQLSTYIAVNADGTVTGFFGKMDMGQGLATAVSQMVAEELDVPFKAVKLVMGDTAQTINQGGASSSNGVQNGGKQLAAAAAEARRVLIDMASQKLGVPADQLTVTDGVISAKADPSKKATYGELIGGRYFNVELAWNKQVGNGLYAPGQAKVKKPSEYKIVGQSIKRADVGPKAFAIQGFVTDIKREGMVHARMIRPPVAGSTPVKVDEASLKGIPGARVVWDKGFLAVVADKEWDAIKASQALKVEWSQVTPPFPDEKALFDHIRKSPLRKREVDEKTKSGDVDEAFKNAARVIEAEYEWPYQSHACMGPGCAVAEIKDGKATVWTGSQKPHYVRDGVAAVLNMPADDVRAIWVTGPGCYGRNDAGDAAMDAAFIAKTIGRPVRVQYTREQGTAWDPKGPASVHKARAAVDASGKITAYEFVSKGYSRVEVDSNESKPSATLAGHFLGAALKPEDNFRVPEESYAFDNKCMSWETIAPSLDRASPLRTSHLRDPVGPQIHFASESFMDELAVALNVDPIELRLRHLKSSRDIDLVKAVKEKSGWDARPSPRKGQTGNKVTGRGIAYAQRSGTRVAIVAEVDVDRSSGKVWARKFTVAHDCGLIINPTNLKQTIEGNVVQGISRALWEETHFDNKSVTSVDWLTYPILDITETPDVIDVVLINRPETAPSGAGEPTIRVVAAALANAIFDATGVRIRRAPLTPERVKAALA